MSVSIPDGLVVLTFDDGVKSQYTFAAPILRECGFNATFYITEGLNFLTDKTRYLTWEEVRKLHDLGFEIGNHTRQHKSVANQSREELLSDIRYIDRQCNRYGIPIPTTFCYPGYTNTPEAVDVLKERGFYLCPTWDCTRISLSEKPVKPKSFRLGSHGEGLRIPAFAGTCVWGGFSLWDSPQGTIGGGGTVYKCASTSSTRFILFST